MGDASNGIEYEHKIAPQDDLVQTVLDRWIGTPYRPNMRVRGVGTDCRMFVACVHDTLEDLYHEIPPVPPDIGQHSVRGAARSLKAMVDAFDARSITHERAVMSGDVLALYIGPCTSPVHIGIVSAYRGVMYHAHHNHGVCRASMADARIAAVYRTARSHQWRS